jgi:hypothetical protein
MYSLDWNCVATTFRYIRVNDIFSRSVHLFCCSKIGRQIVGIYKSQIHTNKRNQNTCENRTGKLIHPDSTKVENVIAWYMLEYSYSREVPWYRLKNSQYPSGTLIQARILQYYTVALQVHRYRVLLWMQVPRYRLEYSQSSLSALIFRLEYILIKHCRLDYYYSTVGLITIIALRYRFCMLHKILYYSIG